MSKNRNWRVEITHVNGYTAPSSYVTTTESREGKAKAKAIQIAKSESRLADFPCYIFKAYELKR